MRISKSGIISAAIGVIAFLGGCAVTDVPLKETVWIPVSGSQRDAVRRRLSLSTSARSAVADMSLLDFERGRELRRFFLFRQIEEIIDSAADPALEVGMGTEIGVEPQFSIFDDDSGNRFLVDKQFQGIVNRCPGQRRLSGDDRLIDRVRRRVNRMRKQIGINRQTLGRRTDAQFAKAFCRIHL